MHLIKNQDNKPAISIDWNNGSVYFLCDNGKEGTTLHSFSFQETKNLLQMKVSNSEETRPLLESSEKFFDIEKVDEAEKAYAQAITIVQRSFHKYYVGDDQNIKVVRKCCWGCCLY